VGSSVSRVRSLILANNDLSAVIEGQL
jgi:hypothetical protein